MTAGRFRKPKGLPRALHDGLLTWQPETHDIRPLSPQRADDQLDRVIAMPHFPLCVAG